MPVPVKLLSPAGIGVAFVVAFRLAIAPRPALLTPATSTVYSVSASKLPNVCAKSNPVSTHAPLSILISYLLKTPPPKSVGAANVADMLLCVLVKVRDVGADGTVMTGAATTTMVNVCVCVMPSESSAV